MEIMVSSNFGQGLTELSAFDNALSHLGVRDQNLIHLSSVIPIGFKVCRGTVDFNSKYQGDKVYCVYAEKRTSIAGVTVASGLGWVTTDNPHWGLFVEHAGHTEGEVETKINNSLETMMKYRTEYSWSEIHTEITSATCQHDPVCAMALAVYRRESW